METITTQQCEAINDSRIRSIRRPWIRAIYVLTGILIISSSVCGCARQPYRDVEWRSPAQSYRFYYVDSMQDDASPNAPWKIVSIDYNEKTAWLVATNTSEFSEHASPSFYYTMDLLNLHEYDSSFPPSTIESLDGSNVFSIIIDTSIATGPNIMPYPSYDSGSGLMVCAPLENPQQVKELLHGARRDGASVEIVIRGQAKRLIGSRYRSGRN